MQVTRIPDGILNAEAQNEYSCQSGNHSDIIRISFQYYPDAEAAGTGTD